MSIYISKGKTFYKRTFGSFSNSLLYVNFTTDLEENIRFFFLEVPSLVNIAANLIGNRDEFS